MAVTQGHRTLTVWLSVLVILAFAAGCGGSSTPSTTSTGGGALAKAKAANQLVVATAGGAPIAWVDPSGTPMGITIDICKEMIKREGIKDLVVYTMPFASEIPALQSGRIDFSCDTFFPTDKRKKIVQFTNIIFYNSETIIVPKGNPKKIHSVADCSGKTCSSYEGTVWIDWLNGITPKVNVVPYPSPTELMAAVSAGRVDGAIIDAVLAEYALKQNPSLNFDVVKDYAAKEKITNAVALPARYDSNDVIKAFNDTLAAMKADGSLNAVFAKYGLTASFYLSPT